MWEKPNTSSCTVYGGSHTKITKGSSMTETAQLAKLKILAFWHFAVLCLVAQSCSTLCDPMDWSPSAASVCGDSPGKNTTVGCHAFFQGIFLTQGLNPDLLHCRGILYHLSPQGSPIIALGTWEWEIVSMDK